ncbi:MAG: EAL domain-containing protein [Proteobacteria bacterium]|nr:EAL domain-containing protein [Pseudomonadota bacterium]
MGHDPERTVDDQAFYAELLRAYFDSTNDAIFVLCDEMKFLACNQVMQDWLGMPEAELTRHNERIPIIKLFNSINAEGAFESNFAKALAGEPSRFVTYVEPPKSASRWIEISMRLVNIESGEMVIAVGRDISDRKAYLDAMERQATIDPTTGLINRQVFQEHLNSTIKKDHAKFAVALLDIDRFRDINESLGYPIGDHLLKLVAGRFQDYQKEHDITVAGLGGDSFAVLLMLTQDDDLEDSVRELQRFLSRRIRTRAGELILDFTTGIALYPEHAENAEDLLHRAESALHSAKTLHSRMVIYHPSHQEGLDHVMLRVDLEHAIQTDSIIPHYQPIVHSKTGDVRVELLARWQHKTLGNISPEVFIPLAEYTGLITDLTLSLVKQAAAECAPFIHDGSIKTLSINISPYSLRDASLAEHITAILARHGLGPQHVMLELTEGSIIPDSESIAHVMNSIGELGYRLAVDDFGTGHSSLVRLKLLPIAELKIDKSFVINAHNNTDDQIIIRAALTLAHNLNLEVVAEGVETNVAVGFLSALGCDYLQGFIFSKARPIAEMPDMLVTISERFDALV